MTGFWLVAACLFAGALLFLLPPLVQRAVLTARGDARSANAAVYRSQLTELEDDGASDAQREALRAEIEQRALRDIAEAPGTSTAHADGKRDTMVATAIAVLVPLLALGLYWHLGSPALITGQAPQRATDQAPHALDSAQILQMVDRLAKRLSANPADPDGWTMLARSYTALGRYREAATAYERALEQRGDDAQLLADYADLLAMLQDRKLTGKPAMLVARALELDRNNGKALALAGTAAYEQRDYAAAAGYWEQLLQQAPAGSDLERTARANIAEARALAQGKPAPAAASAATAAAPPAGGDAAKPAATASANTASTGGIVGTVRVDERWRAKLSPDAAVFVVARAAEGPRMPLAIVRLRLADLPARFTLDDQAAMSPQMRVSAYPSVVVSARVSPSGNAMPAAGDVQSASVRVDNTAQGVELVIDQEVRR